MKISPCSLRSLFSHSLSLAICGLLPSILVLSYFFYKWNKLDELQERIDYLQQKKERIQAKKTEESQLVLRLKNTDRDYVENHLESLQFLKSEIKKLHVLLHSDPTNKLLKNRLNFLEGPKNRLSFSQKNFQRIKNIQEVEEITRHPIEMNIEDLKEMLSKIETVSHKVTSVPQLIVKKFDLLRKTKSNDEETYLVQLELIKREILDE